MSRGEPKRETLAVLRATRDSFRLATNISLERRVGLDTVHCAVCGRPIAVATDLEHQAKEYEGRVVCGACLKSRRPRVPGPSRPPPLELEPRFASPTHGQRLRAWFQRQRG
jgi:hypothetical protein